MSKKLNYKQVANVSRRTWDVEAYDEKAKARTKALESTGKGGNSFASVGEKRPIGDDNDEQHDVRKEEFLPAASSAPKAHGSQRALLKARSNKVDLDSKIGTVEMISPEAIALKSGGTSNKDGVVKTGVGWQCRVCDCFLKDSLTYLDHINGRKHQKNLGYSMRVERSSKNDVASRLERLAKAKAKSKTDDIIEDETDYREVVEKKDEDEKRRKEERAQQRKERKLKKKEAKLNPPKVESDNEEEVASGGLDPAMAAMMGFSSFGK